jgi:hypothetical protein
MLVWNRRRVIEGVWSSGLTLTLKASIALIRSDGAPLPPTITNTIKRRIRGNPSTSQVSTMFIIERIPVI